VAEPRRPERYAHDARGDEQQQDEHSAAAEDDGRRQDVEAIDRERAEDHREHLHAERHGQQRFEGAALAFRSTCGARGLGGGGRVGHSVQFCSRAMSIA